MRAIAQFPFVMAGLDPAIHPLRKSFLLDGYAGQARV